MQGDKNLSEAASMFVGHARVKAIKVPILPQNYKKYKIKKKEYIFKNTADNNGVINEN